MKQSDQEKHPQRCAAHQLFILNPKITAKELAKALGLPSSTASRWQRRFSSGGGVADGPRSGRPRVLSRSAAAETLTVIQLQDSSSTAKAAAALSRRGHAKAAKSTVRRAEDAGWVWKHNKLQPSLTTAQRVRRVDFALEHADDQWAAVLFSDSKSLLICAAADSAAGCPPVRQQRQWAFLNTAPAYTFTWA